MNQPDTLSLAGTAGPARSAGVPRCPSAPEEQKFGFKEFTPIGANERPVTATPPAHRRHTCDHPIAPTGTLRIRSARKVVPVVTTQRAETGLRHTALGWGTRPCGHADERRLPQGGSPWNLLFDDGQRPTIHRPQRCRRPNGHRASVTPDRTTETFHGLGGYKRGWGGRASPFPHARPDERVPLATRHSETTCLAGKFTTDIAWWARVWANVRVSEVDSGGPVLYGVVRALGRFPIQSGPPTFAHLAADMGGPPFGKGRMANWRPHRPAVFAGSSACCDAGACPGALSVPLLPYFTVFVAAAGLLGTLAPPQAPRPPRSRDVTATLRSRQVPRPTGQLAGRSSTANAGLPCPLRQGKRSTGVYLRDLAPDARRRNPQVPAPNAGPPPAAAPIRQLLHPTGIPAGWPSAPAVPPTPWVGEMPPASRRPMSDGPTGLLIAEPRRRGPPCRAVIAQDRRQLVGRSRGRARVPSRSPCSPKSDRRLVAPEEPRAVAHRRPCRVGNWRPHRASTAQSGHRDPLRVAHASKATGDPPGPVERAVAHPVAVAMSDGPTGVSCPRSPSKRPALPDPLVGGVVHKSSQGRADAQRLVATRLLDRLHDPLGHFSPSSPGLLPGSRRQPAEVRGPEAYSYPTTTCGATSPRSGTDSDLEAFSHYPADGSVAALPGQTAAKTNYLNQRFLSY
ncbi:hypothetical protein OAory_01072920 [Aspergillus oryzae]|uniref:Uncharacterized protein n=9 Tax=Aspergillus TaxID=5052 RepID=A0A1S9D3X6_ASPOZ|nr:hypothetical protein OAory_01072920 [Aspergillus oryzae]